MAGNLQNRRRNYFIDKKFQGEFITKFCSLVVIGSFLSGIIIYWVCGKSFTTAFVNSRLVIKSTADFIIPAVLLSSVVVIISVGIATIIITLLTSHRIAGPLYRIQKDIEELSSGNLRIKFNLRQRDELKALAGNLEIMTRNLQAKIAGLKNSLSELSSEVERLKAEKSIEAKAVEENLSLIKKELDTFTV